MSEKAGLSKVKSSLADPLDKSGKHDSKIVQSWKHIADKVVPTVNFTDNNETLQSKARSNVLPSYPVDGRKALKTYTQDQIKTAEKMIAIQRGRDEGLPAGHTEFGITHYEKGDESIIKTKAENELIMVFEDFIHQNFYKKDDIVSRDYINKILPGRTNARLQVMREQDELKYEAIRLQHLDAPQNLNELMFVSMMDNEILTNPKFGVPNTVKFGPIDEDKVAEATNMRNALFGNKNLPFHGLAETDKRDLSNPMLHRNPNKVPREKLFAGVFGNNQKYNKANAI